MPISKNVKSSGLNALKSKYNRKMFHEICEAYGIDSAAEEQIWFDVQLLGQKEKPNDTDIMDESENIHNYLSSLIVDAAERELKEIDFPIAEFVGNITHIIDEVIRKISDKFKIPSVVLFSFIWSGMLPVLAPAIVKVAAHAASNYLSASAKAALKNVSEASREYLNTIAVKMMGEKIGQKSTFNKLLAEMVAFKVTGMPLKVLTDKFTTLPSSEIASANTGSALLGGMCLMYGVGTFMGSDIVSNFVESLPADLIYSVPGLFTLKFVAGEAHTLTEAGFSITVAPSVLFVGYKTCCGIKSGLDSGYKGKDFAERLAKIQVLNALLKIPASKRTPQQIKIIQEFDNADLKEAIEKFSDEQKRDVEKQQEAFNNYYLYQLTQSRHVQDESIKNEAKKALRKKTENEIDEAFRKNFPNDKDREELEKAVVSSIEDQFIPAQQRLFQEILEKQVKPKEGVGNDQSTALLSMGQQLYVKIFPDQEQTIIDSSYEKAGKKIKSGHMPGETHSDIPIVGAIGDKIIIPISRTLRDKIILPTLDIIAITIGTIAAAVASLTLNPKIIEEVYNETAGIIYINLSKPLDIKRLDRTSEEWKILKKEWEKNLDSQVQEGSQYKAKKIKRKIARIDEFIYKIDLEKEKLNDNVSVLGRSIAKLPMIFSTIIVGSNKTTRPSGNTLYDHIGGYFGSIQNYFESGRRFENTVKTKIDEEQGTNPKDKLIRFMTNYQNMSIKDQNIMREDLKLTPAQIYSCVYDYMREHQLTNDETLVRDAHKFLLQERRETIDLMFLSPVLLVPRAFILIPSLIALKASDGESNIARYYMEVSKEGYKADFQGIARIAGKCTIPMVTVLDFLYDTFLSRGFRTLGRRISGGRKKLNLNGLDKMRADFEEKSDNVYESQKNVCRKGSLVQKILENTKYLEDSLSLKGNNNKNQEQLIDLYIGVVKRCCIFENLINTRVDEDNIDDILKKLDFAIDTIKTELEKVHMDDSLAVLGGIEEIRDQIREIKDSEGEYAKAQELLSSNRLKGFCLKDVFQGFLSKFTFETSLFNQKTQTWRAASLALFVNTDDFSKKLVDCSTNVNRYKTKVIDAYSKIESSLLPDEVQKHVTEVVEDQKKSTKSKGSGVLNFRKYLMGPTFLNAMGDATKISSRVNKEKERAAIERTGKIEEIHKILSDNGNAKPKDVANNFTGFLSTLNTLEDQTSEQPVDQEVVEAMRETMDIIHQKVKQTGTYDDAKEAHEAIKRANQIAKIHKFLNDNSSGCVCDQRNGPNDSQEVIGAFTEFHNILNSLDVPNSEQTVRGNDLKTMHGCLDNICEKIEQNSSINDVHEQIKCACCDGNSGLGVN